MMFRNQISLFVAAFLIIGFFFLALPEKGLGQELCCLFPGVVCTPIENAEEQAICIGEGGDVVFAPCSEVPECAVATNVPTLSEWGLIAMAGILGIVGFMVIRRRKASA